MGDDGDDDEKATNNNSYYSPILPYSDVKRKNEKTKNNMQPSLKAPWSNRSIIPWKHSNSNERIGNIRVSSFLTLVIRKREHGSSCPLLPHLLCKAAATYPSLPPRQRQIDPIGGYTQGWRYRGVLYVFLLDPACAELFRTSKTRERGEKKSKTQSF